MKRLKRHLSRRLDPFLLLLAGGLIVALSVMFLSSRHADDGPAAVQGKMDLSTWDFASSGTVPLNGEWAFYPGLLLTPEDFSKGTPAGVRYLDVPSAWNQTNKAAYGSGTYRLQVRMKPTDELLAIHKQVIRFADALYVDGKLLGSSGQTGPDRAHYKPGNKPYTVYFHTRGDLLDLVIQVSNYEYPSGGLVLPLRLGLNDDIQLSRMMQTSFEWAGAIVLLLFALFSFSLYFFFQRKSPFLVFGCFFFLFGLLTVLNGQRMLLQLIPELPFEVTWKVKDITILLTLPFLYTHTALNYPPGRYRRYLFGLVGVPVVYVLFLLCVPYHVYAWSLEEAMVGYVMLLFGLLLFNLISYCRGQYGQTTRRELQLYIAGLAMLGLVSINSAFVNVGDGTFLPSALSDLFGLLFILFFTIMLAYRYVLNYNAMAKLTIQLQAADRLKDDFLLRTSDELNTPLQGIMNLSHALLQGDRPGMKDRRVRGRDKLLLIRNTAFRMSNLVNDIVDLIRIKDGRLEVSLGTVDLAACTSVAFEVNGFLASEKAVRLDSRIDSEARYAIADENRFMQAFSRLLDQGMKFPDLVAIAVSSFRQEAQIVLVVEVIRSSPGLPENEEKNLFGAGLSAADELIRLMDGSLMAKVDDSAGGVRFELRLPAAESDQISRQSERQERSMDSRSYAPIKAGEKGGVYTVLVVDNETQHLELMVNLLTEEGYRVLTARTAEEALRLIDSATRPDIILLDVLLPGGGGYALSRDIRKTYTPIDLPLLFVTSRTTSADVEAGLAAGGNDFITKPLDASEVRVRIRTLLAMKRLAKEAAQSEMAFLQSQIKPHFLYNALGTIMSLCYTDGPRAGQLLAVLSKYLRIIFHEDQKEESVLLYREIELVRAYVDIEKARFGSRLDVIIDVDEELFASRIMPLTIQPLVENAIRHGVAKKVAGGQVKLTVHRRMDEVVIVVEDDGIGMSERQVRELTDTGRRNDGIGFANIVKRLAHLTGARPTVESAPNEGTRITIKVPYYTDWTERGGTEHDSSVAGR